MTADFYIVATPIGNLSDITYRAVEVLKKVDYIACEDTRVTRILLDKYEISAKTFDCHKFNEKQRAEKIISLLREGKSVALVSDAGTPLISDPGSELIRLLLENDINIISVPGACAVTAFLTYLPRRSEEYAFIGFIPRVKKQQIEILNKYKYTNCVFYESPNRLSETLENIKAAFGEETKIAVGRELTKVFEEVKIAPVREIIDYYKTHPLKGEIVVMVFACENRDPEENEIIQKITALKEEGYCDKDISVIISKLFGISKNKVYKLSIEN